MSERLVVPCEDGDIILEIDYDAPGRIADLDKLDIDFKLIGDGILNIELPPDTYNYGEHKWESPNGKQIGKLFTYIDGLSPEQRDRMLIGDGYLEQVIIEAIE